MRCAPNAFSSDDSRHGPARGDERAATASQAPSNAAGGRQPPNELKPADARPGDVLFEDAGLHARMHTTGARPIAHAACSAKASVVLKQSTESYANRLRRNHVPLKTVDVFRMEAGNEQAAVAAARIAGSFATEADGPGRLEPSAQTPYSLDRMHDAQMAQGEDWTQASAFRAVRAALRSQEPAIPLSARKGTSCGAFIATALQAGVIADALANETLPAEAKEAIQHIKDRQLHMPGVTSTQFQNSRDERYSLISPQASEQLKRLMPLALQFDAKTLPATVLRFRMGLENSGFEHVGYANPHARGLQLLPEGHPLVDAAATGEEVSSAADRSGASSKASTSR